MFSKIASIFILCLTVQSFAQSDLQNNQERTLEINGQLITLINVIESSGVITEGRIKTASDIKFGKNLLKSVPKNTDIRISLNSEKKYYISLMVLARTLPVQKWEANGVLLNLNCSPYGAEQDYRVRVVTFYENLQMNGRCTVVEESVVETATGDEVVLAKEAIIFLTAEGKLKSASKIKEGEILVFNQKVKLREGAALDYNGRGGLHFFYMKDGESFWTQTDLGTKTTFKQHEGAQGRPFLLYDSGSIESGYVELESSVQKTVRIFEQEHSLEVLSGQMGFAENGRLDRFVLGEEREFVAGADVKIFFVNARERELIPGSLKAGEILPLNFGSNLFLVHDPDGASRLQGFPVRIQGQIYFLSLTGTNPSSLPGQ